MKLLNTCPQAGAIVMRSSLPGGGEGILDMATSCRNRQPVEGLPVGLVSWYAPGERAVALVTYWVAMIGGDMPRLRASWPGRRDPRSLFWAGGDFVLNIPSEKSLPMIRQLASLGRVCLDVEDDLGVFPTRGGLVNAPRLDNCPVQIECCSGCVDQGPVEPEVFGHVLLLRRGEVCLSVDAGLDVAELDPFRQPSP